MSQSSVETERAQVEKMKQQHRAFAAKISRKEGRIREKERKARNRLLFDYGGLVDLAGWTGKDKGTVLGLLLEGARRDENGDVIVEQWKAEGDQFLAQRAAERRVANEKKQSRAQPGKQADAVGSEVDPAQTHKFDLEETTGV